MQYHIMGLYGDQTEELSVTKELSEANCLAVEYKTKLKNGWHIWICPIKSEE